MTEMGGKQHHFVLVHGAFHGAWCWVKVVAALEKAGHRATAVDLASAGESPVQPDDVTSFEQYNQPLEDLFASFPDDEKVVLVGHSMGGMNITRIAELYPKKVSVAVFLAAFMPLPGVHLFDMMVNDPEWRPGYECTFRFKVEGGPPTSQAVTPETLKNYYYNRSSPEDVAFAVDHCGWAPFLGPIFDTIHGTRENYGSVPRVYVLARDDKAVLPINSRKLIKLNPPNEVIEIDSDHSLFFSALETLVKILIETAAKYDL